MNLPSARFHFSKSNGIFFQIQSVSLAQEDKYVAVVANHDMHCIKSCEYCAFVQQFAQNILL